MAAAFRILYSPPSASHISHTHLPSPLSSHRLPLSVATGPRKSNLQLFFVKNNPELRALPIIQSESAEEETAEEFKDDEISTTRLLVQNVPWTSTEDDLRPLFQKYGTVVEVEVRSSLTQFLVCFFNRANTIHSHTHQDDLYPTSWLEGEASHQLLIFFLYCFSPFSFQCIIKRGTGDLPLLLWVHLMKPLLLSTVLKTQ